MVASLDIMIIRELVGDICFGEPRGIEVAQRRKVGFNTMIYSERNPPHRSRGVQDRA